jgi:hypothetical protein
MSKCSGKGDIALANYLDHCRRRRRRGCHFVLPEGSDYPGVPPGPRGGWRARHRRRARHSHRRRRCPLLVERVDRRCGQVGDRPRLFVQVCQSRQPHALNSLEECLFVRLSVCPSICLSVCRKVSLNKTAGEARRPRKGGQGKQRRAPCPILGGDPPIRQARNEWLPATFEAMRDVQRLEASGHPQSNA